MFTENEFTRALMSAQQQLRLLANEVRNVRCPHIENFEVNRQGSTAKRIKQYLRNVPTGYGKATHGTDYVYVIRMSAKRRGLPQRLAKRLDQALEHDNDYSRLNVSHMDSDTLYVGRSEKLRSRLQQHLGSAAYGVYAMHLLRWAAGIDAKISISFIALEDKDDLLVQAIEDGLWSLFRPLLGRKGAR